MPPHSARALCRDLYDAQLSLKLPSREALPRDWIISLMIYPVRASFLTEKSAQS